MHKQTKWYISLLVFGLLALGWTASLPGPVAVCGGLAPKPEELIRLHVVANSDVGYDQAVKLKVRDALIDYLSPKLAAAEDVGAARQILIANRAGIEQIAGRTLAENGATYSARAEIGHFLFPVRAYGSLILPGGEYEALRVLLGRAEGKNWWCVLFPPLCMVDVAVANAPATVIPDAGSQTTERPPVKVRWKLVELWQEAVKTKGPE